MKKKVKKTKGNRTEVLLEDLHSKFRVFGESLSVVKEKVNATFNLVGEMKQDIEIMKTDIEFIKTELKKFIRIEEFQTLEKRVALLEKKLSRIY
jgi:hypothetical protein